MAAQKTRLLRRKRRVQAALADLDCVVGVGLRAGGVCVYLADDAPASSAAVHAALNRSAPRSPVVLVVSGRIRAQRPVRRSARRPRS